MIDLFQCRFLNDFPHYEKMHSWWMKVKNYRSSNVKYLWRQKWRETTAQTTNRSEATERTESHKLHWFGQNYSRKKSNTQESLYTVQVICKTKSTNQRSDRKLYIYTAVSSRKPAIAFSLLFITQRQRRHLTY